MKDVLEKMGKINFFIIDDVNKLLKVESEINETHNNVQVIMNLIGNKFNRCTPQFLSKIENHLKSYFFVMNKFDFGNIWENN